MRDVVHSGDPFVPTHPASLAVTDLPAPPERLCLLRLSALGDATHVVPLLRTLQHAWPGTRISWIIGKGERALLDGL